VSSKEKITTIPTNPKPSVPYHVERNAKFSTEFHNNQQWMDITNAQTKPNQIELKYGLTYILKPQQKAI
jgi:hypothetical protein